jgi:hypothetical protein
MPDEDGLPETISALSYRNALRLDTGVDFHHHAARLITAIRQLGTDSRIHRRRELAAPSIPAQRSSPADTPMIFWRKARFVLVVFAVGVALVVAMLVGVWLLNIFRQGMTPVLPTSNVEKKTAATLPTSDVERFPKTTAVPVGPPTDRTSAPEVTSAREGWNTYLNVSQNLPSSLQPRFVAFKFDYPKSFNVQPQSDVNFVKVEKYAAAGKGNTAENFAVGHARFDDPNTQSEALYNQLLDQLGQQMSGRFHNYKELKRNSTTVDGIKCRTALFQADFANAPNIQIFGKTIVVHPPGKEYGVTILMLGTSMSRDIKSADDLGTKGDTADIVRSFTFL